jgi:hypothetical protein
MNIAKQATLAPSRETINLALVLIIEVVLTLGVIAIALRVTHVVTGSADSVSAGAPFDAAGFRLGEHTSIAVKPALAFDAAAFRRAERADLGAQASAPFDWTAFRLGERAVTSEATEQAAFRLNEHLGR